MASACTGTWCVSITCRARTSGNPVFTTQITYVVNGQSRTQVSATGYGKSPYAVRNIVELIVDPKNPDNYVTPDFFSNWGTPLVLSILGVAFTAIGAWVLRSAYVA